MIGKPFYKPSNKLDWGYLSDNRNAIRLTKKKII